MFEAWDTESTALHLRCYNHKHRPSPLVVRLVRMQGCLPVEHEFTAFHEKRVIRTDNLEELVLLFRHLPKFFEGSKMGGINELDKIVDPVRNEVKL